MRACVCMCACVRACVFVCASVRACVHACVRANEAESEERWLGVLGHV